jgi:nucleoside-diphosphate-sugar epimerase
MGMAHVIPEQLRKAFRANSGDELPVHSADHTRAFSYIDDVVEMLRRMLESESCSARTLNLGTEAPEVTIREVVQTCVSVTGKSLGTIDLPAISGSPERRAPDMRLARELLGYESKVSLFEGISKTWDWYREYVFEGGELTAQ